jgi:hypothetical protein
MENKVKVKLPMKMYGRVEMFLHVFLTSELDGSDWSASLLIDIHPSELPPVPIWFKSWWTAEPV